MRKLLFIIVMLGFAVVVYAAVDSQSKRMAVAGRVNPGDTVNAAYRAAVAGRYVPGYYDPTPTPTPDTGSKLDGRARYNPDRGYRWRYKY